MGKASSVLIMCLLLLVLIPVSALESLPEIPTESAGFEAKIKFEHDITYADWSNLEKEGFIPLRQVTKNEILVWVDSEKENFLSQEFETVMVNPLEKSNSALMLESNSLYYSHYHVLLEPHLPIEGVLQVLEVLKNNNLKIEKYPLLKKVGSMPSSFEISGIVSHELKIDGVWKIEKIQKTYARNDVVASILESGSLSGHELWERGLTGEGVLIAVADTGIDLDHSCFRENNSTVGVPGDNHRKIQLINTTIDSWDYQNNSDYGHGTHIAGSLSCHWDDGEIREGSSLSYDSKLIVQDIVSENGWEVPENVDVLFLEAAQNGAVIHSDSWGDNEINYTKRSGDFDGWGREVPWSLIFVAPGNSGGQLMEPANARNVVAVGSTSKTADLEMVSSSSVGPTNLGTRGIFLVAPGKYIISAKSDGMNNSWNNDTISLSGTSMSTPAAASGAAIIQQMVEEGLFVTNKNTNESTGFTPSGPLMKALLSLATTSISDTNTPNPVQGWGVMNISEIISPNFFEEDNSTINNVWIWDSYQYDGDWSSFTDSRISGGVSPIDSLTQNPWDGSGARGPFLSTGEEIRWNFTLNRQDDLKARLSWLAKPEPYLVDELEISIITSDGRIAFGNDLDEDGYSRLRSLDYIAPSSGNETTVGINLKIEDLIGVDWVHVIVKGGYIGIGNAPGSIGIEGDRLGFGLAIKGISKEKDVELNGGGFEEITVEHVLGYTYVGAGGIYENIDYFEAKTLEWDFELNPGNLAVELAIKQPRNISVNLSSSPYGYRTITGLGEDAELPVCSDENNEGEGVNTSSRKWTVTGIWWPPALVDCNGNNMVFMLDTKRLEAPEPLKKLREWIIENGDEDVIAVESTWDLSSWNTPWVEGGMIPERLTCEFRLGNQIWRDCELFMTEPLSVPNKAGKLELRWSWNEIGGLNRNLVVEHPIPEFQFKGATDLSFDYSNNEENILSIRGGDNQDVLLILLSESGEHAFVNQMNKSWNLDETSMSCDMENYWVMGIDFDADRDYNIGTDAEIFNDGNLSISVLKLNQLWTEKIETGQIVYLRLENQENNQFLSVPLKGFDLLELHGPCDEMSSKTSNLMLEGVLWMWIILSTIMLVSGFLMWRKQQDLNKLSSEEES